MITEVLVKHFSDGLSIRTSSKFGIFYYINNVKVDIVRYSHPIIKPTLEIDGVRFYSKEDIIAMKVQAVLGRAKKKDFWDIAELLKHYDISDFSNFHKQKFSSQYLLITMPHALLHFDEADDSENPISLKGQTWETVKQDISNAMPKYFL